MKALSELGFPDLKNFLFELIPGAQEYSPDHGHDEASAGGGHGGAADATGGGHGGDQAGDLNLEDIFVEKGPSVFEVKNPFHERGATAAAPYDAENPKHADAPPAPDAGDAPSDGYSARAGAPPAPDAGADPGEGIEMQELATTPKVKDWKKRVSIKYGRGMSIKGTSRTGAKVAEYEKEKGPGNYPYSAFVTDVLRASFLCDDDEAFHMCWKTLEGADPTFHVTRLKNKIAQNVSPFNYHVNGLFKSSPVPKPTVGPRRRRRDRSGRRRDHRAAAAARPLRGGGATAPRRRRDHSADTHVSL